MEHLVSVSARGTIARWTVQPEKSSETVTKCQTIRAVPTTTTLASCPSVSAVWLSSANSHGQQQHLLAAGRDKKLHLILIDSDSVLPAGKLDTACSMFQSVRSPNTAIVATETGKLATVDEKLRVQVLSKCLPHCKFIAASADDAHVALSDSSSAQIHLFNRTLSKWTSLELPSDLSNSRISSLQFSQFRRSMLACGMDDGTVHLFDISMIEGKKELVKTFTGCHEAAVTGLAFSPFNRYLMVTVSLDKKIVLYDVDKMKSARTMVTQHPLTSLAFKGDGTTLAMGTLDGKILVFDLSAKGKAPVSQIDTGSDAITQLRFIPQSTLTKRDSIVKRPVSASAASSISKPTPAVEARTPLAPASIDQSVNYMAMFSPLGNKDKLKDLNPGDLTFVSQPVFKPAEHLPLKKASSAISLPPIRETPEPAKIVCSSTLLSSIAYNRNNPSPINTPRDTSAKSSVESTVFTLNRNIEEEVAANNNAKLKDSVMSKVKESTASKPGSTFTLDVLSSVLDECLTDFRTQIHDEIQNMHLDMLRQFEIQKHQVADLIRAEIRASVDIAVEVLSTRATAENDLIYGRLLAPEVSRQS